MKLVLRWSLCLFALLAPPAAMAQTKASAPQEANETAAQAEAETATLEFVDRYERRFADRDPALETSMADLEAFDEQGKPFRLADSQGQYRVLVFGCLT